MRLSKVLPTTAAVLHLLAKAQSKAVFAHYMVCIAIHVTATHCQTHLSWKVGTVTEAHAQTDIDNAISIG